MSKAEQNGKKPTVAITTRQNMYQADRIAATS